MHAALSEFFTVTFTTHAHIFLKIDISVDLKGNLHCDLRNRLLGNNCCKPKSIRAKLWDIGSDGTLAWKLLVLLDQQG